MTLPKITTVGGGQMAQALVGGMIAKHSLQPSDLTVIAPSATTRDWWSQTHPECHTASLQDDEITNAIDSAEIVLLSVKPHILPDVFANSAYRLAGKLVISIAAGVPLAKLVAGAGHDRVVRVMPNTPSLVGEGASGFCSACGVSESDLQHIESMLQSVGYVAQVTEPQMDALTAVSGSGPAYMFLLIEALADGGVAEGLPRKIALDLAAQTMLGAAKMVIQTGKHPGQLKDSVCSPGGTTIAAVKSLEDNAVRGAMMSAVASAAKRSRELG